MKIYYRTTDSIDAKVVGVRDGCGQVSVNADCFDDIEVYEKLKIFFLQSDSPENFESQLNFDLAFDRIFLRKKGKATDFISTATHLSGGEFFVSERAKRVLDTFHLPKHNYYPVKEVITEKGIYTGYHWLHCPLFSNDNINIKNSAFIVYNENVEFEQIQFANYEELRAHNKSPRVTKIALFKDFPWEIDWFRVRLSPFTFISEALKDAIESNGLTGLEMDRKIVIGI
jgi:hypothetical protein